MGKYQFVIGLDSKLINGQNETILRKYRTILGPFDDIGGYDLVELTLDKEELPIIEDKDGKRFIGCIIEEDNFVSQWCPIK